MLKVKVTISEMTDCQNVKSRMVKVKRSFEKVALSWIMCPLAYNGSVKARLD